MLSQQTARVVQALKALGHDRLTSEILEKLSHQLNQREWGRALKEAKPVTEWVYSVMKKAALLVEDTQ